MKRQIQRKLSLSKETLRDLSDASLGIAAGGNINPEGVSPPAVSAATMAAAARATAPTVANSPRTPAP